MLKTRNYYPILKRLIDDSKAEVFIELFAENDMISHCIYNDLKKIIINDDNKDFINSIKKTRDNSPEGELKTQLLNCIFYNLNYKEIIDIYDDINVIFYFAPTYADFTMINIMKSIKGKVILYDVNCTMFDEDLPGWTKEEVEGTDNAFYYNF